MAKKAKLEDIQSGIKCVDQLHTKNASIYNGDSTEIIKMIPDESIDLAVFSPPFFSLYTYSNSDRDMGNSRGTDEFLEHYKFLAKEQFRIHRSGRVMCVHCMDVPALKSKDGYIGMKDFPGDLVRLYESVGFVYDNRVTIWKDPVTAMQRTKSIRLLHKQIKKDSTISGWGAPDYVLKFKKPGENYDPIEHTNENFPVDLWQKYASPVWMDIKQGDTLNRSGAKEDKDNSHIAPLQLGVIERLLHLWSKEGDVVFTPFLGIGSEVYEAVKMGRKGIGIELKKSYFEQACKNVQNAELSLNSSLFED